MEANEKKEFSITHTPPTAHTHPQKKTKEEIQQIFKERMITHKKKTREKNQQYKNRKCKKKNAK